MKPTAIYRSWYRASSLVAASCTIALLNALPQPCCAHDPTPDQIDAVSRSIETELEGAPLYLHRAELKRVDGQFLEAEKDLRRAQKAGANPAYLRLCWASLYLDRGEFEQGLQSVNSAIEYAPDMLEPYRIRAELLERSGDLMAAVNDLSHLIDREDRPQPEIFIRRSRILELRGPGQLTTAYEGILSGIDRLGPIPTMELRAVELEVRLARFDTAIQRLQDLESRYDNPLSLLVQRAEILGAAGRELDEIALYTHALTLIETEHKKQTPERTELEKRIRFALRDRDLAAEETQK